MMLIHGNKDRRCVVMRHYVRRYDSLRIVDVDDNGV
mgnify:CR=1 FL=1